MNEPEFPPEEEYLDIKEIKDVPQPPLRYQSTGNTVYRQASRGQETARMYYQAPVVASQSNPAGGTAERTASGKTPGAIGFAFGSSLLSLFSIPMFCEFMPCFLSANADSLTYDRETYLLYFLLVLIYGGASAMLAVFGLIFAPVGMNRAKRYDLEGYALGSATILISIVSLLLLTVSIACALVINNII